MRALETGNVLVKSRISHKPSLRDSTASTDRRLLADRNIGLELPKLTSQRDPICRLIRESFLHVTHDLGYSRMSRCLPFFALATLLSFLVSLQRGMMVELAEVPRCRERMLLRVLESGRSVGRRGLSDVLAIDPIPVRHSFLLSDLELTTWPRPLGTIVLPTMVAQVPQLSQAEPAADSAARRRAGPARRRVDSASLGPVGGYDPLCDVVTRIDPSRHGLCRGLAPSCMRGAASRTDQATSDSSMAANASVGPRQRKIVLQLAEAAETSARVLHHISYRLTLLAYQHDADRPHTQR